MPKKSGSQKVTKIVNVRMNPAFVTEIDDLVQRRGYMSRSDFILAAVRYYMDNVAYREEYLNRLKEKGMMERIPPLPKEE